MDWTGILFVVILALLGVTRKTERMFARTAGLYSTPRRPVGVCGIQISRCFVVSSHSVHCSLLCCLSHPAQSSLCRLVWLGWCWLALAGPVSLVQARLVPGGPGPHNSHCAAFSACDPGCCGTRPPLAGRHSRRITQHSTLTGTRDRGPGQIVSVFFIRNIFATF